VRPLKVCIEARIDDAVPGGLQQVLIGLASGLSRLGDGDEEYHFVGRDPGGQWRLPYLTGPCRAVPVPTPPPPAPLQLPAWRLALKKVEPLRRFVVAARGVIDARRDIPPTPTDDLPLKLGAEVMHFPYQHAFPTPLPSIYHPHDLQHLHLPQFFRPHEIRYREVTYRRACEAAAMVAVTSTWIKNDLISHYGLPPEKIRVVPLAPVLDSYPVPTEEDIRAVSTRLRLPGSFAFYPAQTWPHKNHLGLLRALAMIRDRSGPEIHLVFSGHKNLHYPEIEAFVKSKNLESLVHFIGFVSPMELQVLYRLARCTVIPTKFEAASFPLWEAFSAGVAAACSNVTSLPEQAGDAALIFDPDSPEEMATAIERLWGDERLRRTLIERGKTRVQSFNWERTTRTFRAHYRRLAGRPLNEEDRALVTAAATL
jgi:glycosyltransferase involved in cell wall biosynthesis